MTEYSLSSPEPSAKRAVWPLAIGLLIAELVLISVLYKNNFTFTCRDVAPDVFCAFAGNIVPRGLGVMAGFALFALAYGTLVRDILSVPGSVRAGLALNMTGLALAITPWFFVSDASAPPVIALGAVGWLTGGALAASGAALILAPWSAWRRLAIEKGGVLAALVATGMLLPEVSLQLKPVWQAQWLTEVTFDAVTRVLIFVGYTIDTYASQKIIGIVDSNPDESFYIAVGAPCSGIEGFLLISVFLSVYMLLFRRDLAFPNALLLFPIGILVSWGFNVLRIAGLLSLGYHTSPAHAVGGFHSHAGWFAFTILSLLLIFVARRVAFFNKAETVTAPTAPLPPFFEDPTAAKVLPFAVFMLSALIASTFVETPSLVYPFRALAMTIALGVFWQVLRALPWRIDPVSLASGLIIGLAWIATAPAAEGTPPFGTLTGALLIVWIMARMIGTSVLVPVIEELAFRGYLLERLAPSGKGVRMILAILISAALFGALHDRWIAAALAGIVFGGLVYRSGNVTDAVVSHAGANATIAIFALVTGAWHIL